MFAVGSTCNRARVKRNIIAQNLIPYQCAMCGNTGEWMGETLTLQLDHINGVCNDNRIENLRFLCPNCHSITDTYCGKNIKVNKNDSVVKIQKRCTYANHNGVKKQWHKKTNQCKMCGAPILDTSTYCKYCYNIAQRKVANRPSADELVQMIVDNGLSYTARVYHVCPEAIKKWCKMYGLPDNKKDLISFYSDMKENQNAETPGRDECRGKSRACL